ncbi:MAG: hypothetical protein HQM15_02560 [Deltaproteobacteria bacterium]|nr:hypothetical protein [Deltaproteobacteria bacterium]
MKSAFARSFMVLSIVALSAACGGASSDGNVGSQDTPVNNPNTPAVTTQVSSLSKLPDLSSMLDSTSSASISRSLIRSAVSGTSNTPAIQDMSGSNADAIFWNGMLAGINATPSTVVLTDQQTINNFFRESAQCYMAQGVGFSMQNIESSGTSLCYMKRAPAVIPADAVTPATAADAVMSQEANTKVIKINATNMPGRNRPGGNSQTIFIKIFGSSSTEGSAGFAADLWFCSSGAAGQAENIRYNSTSKIMTDTSVNGEKGGIYQNIFSASLLAQSDGSFTFDPDQARSSDMFSSNQGDFKASIHVLGDQLTNKSYNSNTFNGVPQSNKNYSKSQISTSVSASGRKNVFFYQGGVANTFGSGDSSNTFSTGTEWQTDHYVPVTSGTYYDAVSAFSFDTDAFYSSLAEDTTLTASLSNYDCSTTPDIELNMDMGTTAMAPVVSACEQHWQNMNFCNSDAVQNAMNAVFTAQNQMQQQHQPHP